MTVTPDEVSPERPAPRRITVNLTPRASDALDLAAVLTGDSQTAVTGHALQAYAYLLRVKDQGDDVLVRHNQEHGSITERLEFL